MSLTSPALALAGRFFTTSTTQEAPIAKACVRAKSLQSCPTLCNPMDRSLPGSSVHGVLQARILERTAINSSRRSSLGSNSRLLHLLNWQASALPLASPGKSYHIAKHWVGPKVHSVWPTQYLGTKPKDIRLSRVVPGSPLGLEPLVSLMSARGAKP